MNRGSRKTRARKTLKVVAPPRVSDLRFDTTRLQNGSHSAADGPIKPRNMDAGRSRRAHGASQIARGASRPVRGGCRTARGVWGWSSPEGTKSFSRGRKPTGNGHTSISSPNGAAALMSAPPSTMSPRWGSGSYLIDLRGLTPTAKCCRRSAANLQDLWVTTSSPTRAEKAVITVTHGRGGGVTLGYGDGRPSA